MKINTNYSNDLIDVDLFPVLPFENSIESLESMTQKLFENRHKKSKAIKVIDDSEIYSLK